ncbi:iron complex transport system permease protein [Nocardiopsis sp. Huas11]|uniref:FecCD family ABC transporter permease n=1 Tax=Nocardiopsis sp. Huas11 TaxID=2183912 RepID=UPI000EB072CE|nr:iron chelate uptake ABC transporter family permease subunit [Nocardiopsis sp. Huas11]RKS07223.1 iron complex transport system permease protein [Nocardiopsis sp. Huas11]
MTTTTGGGARTAPATRWPGRLRAPLGFLLLGLALAVAAGLSLAVGANPLPPGVVLDALLRTDPTVPDHLVVVEKRVPRTLVGLTAGLALGMAGAVMQGLTRNPLADPGLLGINAGASLFVVGAIGLLGATSPGEYVWFAFAGAAVSAVVVYGVSSFGREGATPVKLALAGAAVTAALTSIVTAVLLVDQSSLDQMRFWQVGAMAARGLPVVAQTTPFIVGGALIALLLGRSLNGLALGDDVARGLGQNIVRTRVLAAVAIVALCGAATASVGPIAFVGLLVPHVARSVVGLDYRLILPFSALASPTLLLVCDVIARVVARPGELQVGIVTAVVGAPLFIALVRRGKAVRL